MPRPKTKEDLMIAAKENYEKLNILISKMSDEELEKSGVNISLTHVDFMIGDATLNILGIKENGEEVQVFKNGNWAF